MIGVIKRALITKQGGAVRKPTGHGLNGKGEPADVSGTPVDVIQLRADLPLHIGPRADQEARGAVDHALRLALGAAR